MEKFENNNLIDGKENLETIFDLIPKLNEINDTDIENLKKELIDEKAREEFDQIPDLDKTILACIHYKLTELEISKLLKAAGKLEVIPGFHKIGGALQYLLNETNNDKYNFLRKK